MSITQSELVSDVQGLLQISSNDTDKFQVPWALNAAQRWICTHVKEQFLYNAVRTEKGNLSQDIYQYQYPASFARALALFIDYDNSITDTNRGTEVRIQDSREPGVITNLDTQPSQEFPAANFGAEGGWEVLPIPDADVTNGWRMRYVRLMPDLSASQDCNLRETLRNLLTIRAALYSAQVNNYGLDRLASLEKMMAWEADKMLPKYAQKYEVK